MSGGCFGLEFDNFPFQVFEDNDIDSGLFIDNFLGIIEICLNFEPDAEIVLETVEIVGNIHNQA